MYNINIILPNKLFFFYNCTYCDNLSFWKSNVDDDTQHLLWVFKVVNADSA